MEAWRAARGGFTLIEALTATAVLAVVILLLAQMAGLATSTFANVVGRTQRQQTLRAIGEGIRSDAASALFQVYKSESGFQFLQNPSSVGAEYRNPSAVFWQAPLASNLQYGDVSVVGYFVQWDVTDPANPRPRLCRVQIDPDPANPNYRIFSAPNAWINSSILNSEAPATRASDYAGLYAEDVAGLWVEVLDENGAVLSRSFDAHDSRLDGMPIALGVSFAVIDRQAAGRINTSMRTAIEGHVAASDDAADFVQRAAEDPSLSALKGAIQSAATTIQLRTAQ